VHFERRSVVSELRTNQKGGDGCGECDKRRSFGIYREAVQINTEDLNKCLRELNLDRPFFTSHADG
jgi:hypothetical protein